MKYCNFCGAGPREYYECEDPRCNIVDEEDDDPPVSIMSIRDPHSLDEMVEAWARFRAECAALGIRPVKDAE